MRGGQGQAIVWDLLGTTSGQGVPTHERVQRGTPEKEAGSREFGQEAKKARQEILVRGGNRHHIPKQKGRGHR